MTTDDTDLLATGDDAAPEDADDLFVDAPDADATPSVDLSHFTFDGADPIGEDTSGPVTPRFDGDTSELPAPVCYALQELISAAHVSGRSRNWRAIEATRPSSGRGCRS